MEIEVHEAFRGSKRLERGRMFGWSVGRPTPPCDWGHQVEKRQVRKFLETVPDFQTAVQRINATGRAGGWL